MKFNYKNSIFLALMALMPFQVQSSFTEVCSSVGQAASIADTAAHLTGYQVPKIVDIASTLHSYASLASLVYGLCFGFKPQQPTTLGAMRGVISDITTLRLLGTLGYCLTPESVKDAVSAKIPEAVKAECSTIKEFVNDYKFIKALALAVYVMYKLPDPNGIDVDRAIAVVKNPRDVIALNNTNSSMESALALQ